MSQQDAVNSVGRLSGVMDNGTAPVDPSHNNKIPGFDPFNFDPSIVNHLTYEFVVMMVLNAVGIQHVSGNIKKTSDLQELEDSIHSIVNDLGKMIQKIQNASTPGQYAINWDEFYKDNQKELNELKAEWKKLFVGDAGSKTASLMDQWKKLLGKDSSNPAYTLVEDLGKGNFEDKWQTKGFTTWLSGSDGCDIKGLKDAIAQAYMDSKKYNDPDFKPGKGNPKPALDPLADSTGKITSTASTVGGLTNSNSAELNQYSQELTSYVQIGQKILSSMDQLKSDMVRNTRQ